jgi:SAM-dependent methyltransferase
MLGLWRKSKTVLGRTDFGIICPVCRNSLGSAQQFAHRCVTCEFEVNTIHGVPVLREKPEESKIDQTDEPGARELDVRNSANEPIPFIEEALGSGGLVLEIGAGIERCTNPNLIKTDGFVYDPALDYVVDAHCLPFEENTFDYAYSLAVFEHLHSPWVAADEIHRVLKPGGKVYTLVGFQQHLHGYPHHYFNVAIPGARRLFKNFENVIVVPSPRCSLDQIAFILMDFNQMVERLDEFPVGSRPKQVKSAEHSERISRLRQAVSDTVGGIAEYGDVLASMPENRKAWEIIAPGLDIIATKPES